MAGPQKRIVTGFQGWEGHRRGLLLNLTFRDGSRRRQEGPHKPCPGTVNVSNAITLL